MELCGPAILYFTFSILQILIDLLNVTQYPQDMYAKLLVIVGVTWLLNVLCEKQLDTVAWMFVFIPLVFMTISSIVYLNQCFLPSPTRASLKVEYIPMGSSSPAYQS